MGVRNLQKGEDAKKALLACTKKEESCSIEVWPLDMDSYDYIKQFASRAANIPLLDALLANAGMFTTVFAITEDKKTITTNVVSTFLLIICIIPKLDQSAE